ncbi:MAG: cytochrome c [Nitrospinae bacterium]|nr:cytochrome c [Nitrospinota bacterium]
MRANRRFTASGWMLSLLVLAAVVPWATAGDLGQGKEVYAQFCASCHGETGKGDGPAAPALTPKPKDLSDKGYMGTKSDEQLFKVVKEGGAAGGLSPLMPPWGTSLTDDQIRDVIAYLRSLAK